MEWTKAIVYILTILAPLLMIVYAIYGAKGNVMWIFGGVVVFMSLGIYSMTYHK
ncbi:MAG: hypothetical protein ACP5RS_00715 [Thermoplasmata archaeon]